MRVVERDGVTITDAITLWTGGTVRDYRGRPLTRPREYSTNRVQVDFIGRELFSYGRHFPLVRFIPGADGAGARFLLNGDEWRGHNSRTRDHQRVARDAVRATGLPHAVIPFSALDGAGIARDSVRILNTRPDADWTESRTAETLTAVPRWARQVSYQVERVGDSLADIPERVGRRTYRAVTDADLASDNAERYGYGTLRLGAAAYLDREPDADGRYRWTETRSRDLAPDADGLYRWTVRVHRLGDAVISGVREIAEPVRRAEPFEHGRDTPRERVDLLARRDEQGTLSDYCAQSETRAHESGPSAACVHCGAELFARPTWKRRARYVSSFDTNESPPLYFLAELPRGAGETVDSALDALAPRAVHAALARGLDVARQGDIFFIGTSLSDTDLAARGIRSRARLTQWTRDARARAGEAGYVRPLSADERRRSSAYARGEYRRVLGDAIARATVPPLSYAERVGARDASRIQWRELFARQTAERVGAERVGADYAAPVSAPCPTCGAAVGDFCTPFDSWERRDASMGEYLTANPHRNRASLAEVHAGERVALRRETMRERDAVLVGIPHSDAGTRARFAKIRASYADDVARARDELRRAALGETRRGYAYRGGYGDGLAGARRALATNAKTARDSFERVASRAPSDSLGHTSPAHARDTYRKRYGSNAVAAWNAARQTARERFEPDRYASDASARRRERVRAAVSIYGTAHTATDAVTLRSGAVYVRGTVRHVPDVAGERREPDHSPIVLGDGARWYLAVRNTVPRSARQRRRRAMGARA